MKKCLKHRLVIVPVIVPEGVLVQVGLQVLRTDRMMRPVDPALDQAPEAVHGVRVGDAFHVDLGRVLDLQVLKSCPSQAAVAGHVVGDDGALGRDVLRDVRHERLALHVGNDLHHNPALTLCQAHSNGLSSGPSPALAGPPTADIGFVRFDMAGELPGLLVHQEANVFENSPGRFVGDAKFALNLLSRNAAAGRGHEIHSMEP